MRAPAITTCLRATLQERTSPECRALRRLVQSNGKGQPSRAFGRSVELDRPDRHAHRVQPSGIDGRDDWPAVVGDNDVGPCPLLDAREKTIINDESSDGDAAKALVDRPDRLGTQEEEPPLIGQGGGAADLVRRLSDEGNEPRAELIRGPERCWRVTAGDHFEIAVIYGKEIEAANLVNGSTICATTPWSRASIASPRSGIFAISCAMLSACCSLSRKPLRTASTLCATSVRFRQSKSLYVLMKMKPMMAISSTAPPITGSSSLRRSDDRSAAVRRAQPNRIQDRMRRLATAAHSIRRFGSDPAYHVVEALRPLDVTCRRQPLEDLVVDIEEGRLDRLTDCAWE